MFSEFFDISLTENELIGENIFRERKKSSKIRKNVFQKEKYFPHSLSLISHPR